MADNPRIEELRRRVSNDPASIAFAQLAEEYRRAGRYEDAIATCHAGLTIHPGYISARVTLGRALIELNELDAGETELKFVLQHAAENLSAIRGLAEIYHRRGELPEALRFYQSALSLAKHDPDLEQTIDEISRALTPVRPPIDDGMTFDEAQAEFLAALDGFEALGAAGDTEPELGAIGASGAMGASGAIGATGAMGAAAAVGARELPELERFLEAIHSYRQRHAV